MRVDEVMQLLGASTSSPDPAQRFDWRSAMAGGEARATPRQGATARDATPQRGESAKGVLADDALVARDSGGGKPPAGAPPALKNTPVPPDLRHHSVPTPSDPLPDDAPRGDSANADFVPGLIVGSPALSADAPRSPWNSLDDVVNAIATCNLCSLYKTAKSHVPGVGNPNADFVCVGEAPGANEDEQGVPFVGQAGQLLTKILAAIDLSRDEVFIVNVLKHRPPGNRNPLPDEVAACSPYLIRQIQLLAPKVLLALGTFAAQTLLQTKEPIGKLRGKVHRYHGVPLVVTYHPAALLRNPAWKRPTWEDVQLARRLLDRALTSGA